MRDGVIHLVARLMPQPGKADELAAAIAAILPEVRQEPGCLAYFAHESLEELGTIVMVEAWADQAALDAHGRAPAFTGLARRFNMLLAKPPVLERLRRIG
ncbi:putative quinol monooxygenase [Pedomonas mirosovicensis]|uniref:putative quinol monooxygenase n=1 Tax=Pedomonas mirosovicensis TaxID=2908641 RepID=UPI002166EC45|nr:putative quinol monooxygenase [Pedomonas mirosovicensis]MCH8686314.1 antibiotic biosynthesis monooxygenase [Pedomonas mirosovicensis]